MAHILLIEDEFRLRENISELLELYNHQVTSKENGLEGLLILNTFKPDIIICDIMMPVLDGIKFITTIKSDLEKKSIPVIFISAKVDTEDIKQGLLLGAIDYIKKPFPINDLIKKINIALKSV